MRQPAGRGRELRRRGTGGWTFSATGSSSGAFVPGIGAGGTRAARISLAQRCDGASMETRIDVPAVENPALEMFVGVNAGANAAISLGGILTLRPFETIPNVATTRTIKTCLPPAMRGQSLSARFALSGGSGLCSELLNHQPSSTTSG